MTVEMTLDIDGKKCWRDSMKNIFTRDEMLADVKETAIRVKAIPLPINWMGGVALHKESIRYLMERINKELLMPFADHGSSYHVKVMTGVIHFIETAIGCAGESYKSKMITTCWRERVLGVWVKEHHRVHDCCIFWWQP